MNAVILCPGTSLASAAPLAFPLDTTVIAVNRASVFFPAHIWACGDYTLIEKERQNVRGQPELFTTAEALWHLRQNPWPWRVLPCFETLDSYNHFPSLPPQWQVFTAIAAVVYAAFIGCRKIEVFGADWRGQADFDGVLAGGNRSPERWQLEKNIFQNVLTPWLTSHGVSLYRHCG